MFVYKDISPNKYGNDLRCGDIFIVVQCPADAGSRTLMPTPLDYKLFFDETDDYDIGGREYWDSGHGAAGCIFIAKNTGRILLAHRSHRVDFEPNTWGTWGGKVDEDETPKDTVQREVEEETGFDGRYTIHFLWTFEDPEAGFQYHNYLILVPMEFDPQLNWENNNFDWVDWGDWPQPLHFGMEELIKHAGGKIKRIIDLIRRKRADVLESVSISIPSIRTPQCLKENNSTIFNQGLAGDGVWAYEMRSPQSYIRYRYEPDTKTFYLDNIGTPNVDDKNKGYAKALLESFFQLIKQYGGALDSGPYTSSGMAYIKPVVERFAKQYGVRLVQGKSAYD